MTVAVTMAAMVMIARKWSVSEMKTSEAGGGAVSWWW